MEIFYFFPIVLFYFLTELTMKVNFFDRGEKVQIN